MSLDTGRYQVFSALKSLQETWEDTKPLWNDPVRQDFEENFWYPLEDRTRVILSAIDLLAQVLVRARKDCRE